MKKIILANSMLLLAAIISIVYYHAVYESISGGVIRLHILPNSGRAEDMAMKTAVRDEILSVMATELSLGTSRADIAGAAEKIKTTANEYLLRQNAPYSADVRLEVTAIPQKSYNNITMPAGEYTAIRVLLGEGSGENWWCVAYPPLCFTEEVCGELSAPGRAALAEAVGQSGYNIISGEVKYELKLVEWAEKLITLLKNAKN